jgi:hypothetical protein
MYEKRPKNFRMVFEELHVQAKGQHEEALRRQQRKERKFKELLDDYFYR